MATIHDIHQASFDIFQKLIPKSAIFEFPNSANSVLQNKKFAFSQVSASSVDGERLKNTDTIFSNNAIQITIFDSVLENTTDTTDTISAPRYGYKQNNAVVRYKTKQYIIKDEILNEFDNSITFLCDTKV